MASSPMATPLDPDAWMLSAPLLKLTLADAPSRPFKVDWKEFGSNATGPVPFRFMVRASKSISTLLCTTPVESTTSMVVLPVKPETAVGRSRPVLRPVRVVGGGTALEALWALLIWSTAWLTYSPSWAEMAGISTLRVSTRPLSTPALGCTGRAVPLGAATRSCPGVAPVVENDMVAGPARLINSAPPAPRTSRPPSSRRETVTSTIEDKVLISWLWAFCAPVVSPPATVCCTRLVFRSAICLSRSLTWPTVPERRLSTSWDREVSCEEIWDDWSRKLLIAVRAWLRETVDAGSWAADEKAENASSS